MLKRSVNVTTPTWPPPRLRKDSNKDENHYHVLSVYVVVLLGVQNNIKVDVNFCCSVLSVKTVWVLDFHLFKLWLCSWWHCSETDSRRVFESHK